MGPGVLSQDLEACRMSNEAPKDDEVVARVRAAVAGDFQPEHGLIDARSSRPPIKQDEVDRDRRRQSAEKQKSTVDLKKKKEKKRNLDRQALETHRAMSRQRWEPEEESPDEDDGGDGGDDSDDSEGMASRLDRILEGPHPTIVDVPRTEAPKGAPSGPRESQQRQPSPRRSRADTPPEPAPGRTVPCPQPPPASKVGHRVKSLMMGPLTRGHAVASSKGGTDRRSASLGAGQAGDAELRPAPAREGPGASTRGGSKPAGRGTGSSDPRSSTGVEGALPRPLVGESAPPSQKRIEAPRPQEQEGAPEPPRSRVEEDPITISDGSGGDGPLKDARPMYEEVEAPPTTKQTPWPIGLHSVEERRKKEEEEHEQETRQQLREGRQQP
ncbi:uncharacterized protein LOC110436446 [Sorghum bicolor]|uniref:uncharacterized protein LOC110436446 n=1 Tax=Sorghum bicolor TaxID=4558 RepID=UPI000B424990|nr:uncharacterized protein LOC110436446 [Sorghum bicolor]|eukprot:XP_021319220.1 uncharacterized protein LOC110436446 [Sorghum bicolor]